MLVVPRRDGQTLIIKLEDCEITVAFLGMEENRGRIGIEAPQKYDIIRGENNEQRDAGSVSKRLGNRRRPS